MRHVSAFVLPERHIVVKSRIVQVDKSRCINAAVIVLPRVPLSMCAIWNHRAGVADQYNCQRATRGWRLQPRLRHCMVCPAGR